MKKKRFRTKKQIKPWPRVLVGLPMERTVPERCFWDKLRIYHRSKLLGATWIEDVEYANRIDVIRNKMDFRLLRTDNTHLLMLDLDHFHPDDIYERLVSRVVEDPDRLVVGGWNFRRGVPFDPCVQFWGKDGELFAPIEWDDGFIKIERTDDYLGGAIGTGSILISREVFEQIPPPWFTFDYSKWPEDSWIGEDITFGRLCMEHGIAQFADTELTSPHLDNWFITRETFEKFKATNEIKYKSEQKISVGGS